MSRSGAGHMNRKVTLTITLLLFYCLICSNALVYKDSINLEKTEISDVPVENEKAKPQFVDASKKMIRLRNNLNQTVTVALDCQENITCIVAGNSTMIKISGLAEEKIDSNLLNLTRIVTEGYMQDNQTNVILSFRGNSSCVDSSGSFIQTSHGEFRKLHTSQNANQYQFYYSACLDYSSIFDLARMPQTDHIWLDRRFSVCLDQSVNIIKDPVKWLNIEATFGRKINGTGVRIAILDTGIDPNHPDFFFLNGSSKILREVSFTSESTNDGFGHGTHCASIAAGTGAASSGQYVGVAAGASLLNVKVLDNSGEGLESWIISGIQWAVDNHADVINMSFGTDINGDGSDPLSTTVNWATSQGVVCAVAAGNSGPEMFTMGVPAVAKSAITVGASSKQDIMAGFSSKGPTSDFRTKPDMTAPGVDIVAARASGTSMGTPISQYYTRASGTSMATPHVAGAAALVLDARPYWSPYEVKMVLINYGKDLNSTALVQGTGRLNICEALNASLIGEPNFSFGRVELNRIYKHAVTFQNLASYQTNAVLSADVWRIEDQTHYPIVELNVTVLTLPSAAEIETELTLDTDTQLPSGFYEGKITTTFNDRHIRIPFIFCILAQLDVSVVDESGHRLMAAFAVINADTGQTENYVTESDQARFIIPMGNYVVQAMNIYKLDTFQNLDAKMAFVIHEEFSIGIDQTLSIQLSLAQAYKLPVRNTGLNNQPLHLRVKHLLTPYFYMGYLSDIGTLPSQYLYLTNISDYVSSPCYFGFAGFQIDDIHYTETGTLTSEIDSYFIGWDISTFGHLPIQNSLSHTESEMATFNLENRLPKSSAVSTMWFNQIANMWQAGLWQGYETHPGMNWKVHLLPYQFKGDSSGTWSLIEWSCIYAMSSFPDNSAEYYVLDRHFDPISKGETFSCSIGKTPLLPQSVVSNPAYYGIGLYIPYYPLFAEENIFLAKSDQGATKRLEVVKDGLLIYNNTKPWAQEPIAVSSFLNSNGHGVYSFTLKTETSLDYSIVNIAKYTINNIELNPDLIPPTIAQVNCKPSFNGTTYHVEMRLEDNSGISSVSLLYSLDNGPWTPASLINLGGGVYSADITFSLVIQQISLAIQADDVSGNSIYYGSKPVSVRSYKTQLQATLNGNVISGKLTVTGSALPQQVYIKVKSSENILYTLTDLQGNFVFSVPETMIFPLVLELANIGKYEDAHCIVDRPQVHDVAVNQLTCTKTIASGSLPIVVTVANQGDYVETVNLYVFANSSIIASQTLVLASKESRTLSLIWNLVNVSFGDYVLRADVPPVSGETHTADNTVDGEHVLITRLGDLNGDFKVTLVDLVVLAKAYSSRQGDSNWNSNADFNSNGVVDLVDLVTLAANYGHWL
jgi:serine protease AprX